MSGRTLLAHIAPMTTIQLENLATGALYYLLTKYPPAADAFHEFLVPAAPSLPPGLQYRTQAVVTGGGIPDMVGLLDGAEVLLVESKF